MRGTGWIGDAIYGVNDGLGAVFGIVSGMAGYTGGSEVVLAAGLAGTLASALSMGAGAYLASKSEREVYESEVARETDGNPGGSTGRTPRARAVLSAQRACRRKKRRAWRRAWRRSRSSSCGRWCTKSSGSRRRRFPNPMKSTISADRFDGHRRIHPDHPVLLHGRHAGGDRLVHHQHDRPFRGGRIESADHHAAVVGHRHGDDRGRRHRSRRHLRPGAGIRAQLR